MKFACPHLGICSGCAPIAPTLREQQDLKLQNFLTKSGLARDKTFLHDLGEGFLRTRLELTWQNDHWGFYSQVRDEILAIETCHQVDPRLDEFFKEFKKITWPMKKGSVRLRLGKNNRFGIWLDLANEDVRDLFESKTELLQCLKIADVEVGQRRKSLIFEEERFRLKDPVFDHWISTFSSDKEIFLRSLIGGFSQTGPRATKVIAHILEKILHQVSAHAVLEFGSGFGTLTVPASQGRRLVALEVDERSVEALRLTLQENKIDSAQVLRGDFQKKKFSSEEKFDTYLVNPPRSGVQNLLLEIPISVKNLVYMSCFEESFFKDSENLKAQGFTIVEAHLIDQFPQTPHTEWMSLWSR